MAGIVSFSFSNVSVSVTKMPRPEWQIRTTLQLFLPTYIWDLHSWEDVLHWLVRLGKTVKIPKEVLPSPAKRVNWNILGFKKVNIASYILKKNKCVLLLSTLHKTPEIYDEEHNKPVIILEYNYEKCGVNTLDQFIRTPNCGRVYNLWPIMIFFNLLNVTGYNAMVLHVHPEYEKKQSVGSIWTLFIHKVRIKKSVFFLPK